MTTQNSNGFSYIYFRASLSKLMAFQFGMETIKIFRTISIYVAMDSQNFKTTAIFQNFKSMTGFRTASLHKHRVNKKHSSNLLNVIVMTMRIFSKSQNSFREPTFLKCHRIKRGRWTDGRVM